jgi:hypothetical protein
VNRSSWAVVAALGVLGATTAYEAAVAFRVIELGSLPGEESPGGDIVSVAAALGLLAGAVLTAALVRVRRPTPLAALLAPSAAAFLVAHFYTFDSYYLPTLIRLSDRDFMPPALVFSVAGVAIASGLLTRVRPWLGLALSAPSILACALTAWFSSVGH